MKTNLNLLGCLSSVFLTLGLASHRAAAQVNVVQPGDPIVLYSGSNDDDPDAGPPPPEETVDHAIDGNTQKYLNFLDLGSGFIVTPRLGSSFAGTIVTGLRFYTANDAPERDPSSYLLEGSVNGPGGPFTVIAGGGLQLPADRNPAGQQVNAAMHFNTVVSFANVTAFTTYRVTFPTLRDAAAANSMQIGEVELLGEVATGPTILFSEGFELAFPGTWSVTSSNGGPTWRDVNSEFGGEGTHHDNWKAYCAGTAYPFNSPEPNPLYANNMAASMFRSFDLSGYGAGQLTFWYKIPDIEFSYDWARVYVDADLVWSNTVSIADWTQAVISLNAYVGGVHTVTFAFESDVSNTAEGWYLDDIDINVAVVAPSITTQPQSRTNCPNTVAVFNVTATGTAPLSYQWWFNGNNIPGATDSSFTIASVQSGNAGDYSVVVANGVGSATSSNATLTVNQPATATPLTSLTRCPGASATFATTAAGTGPFVYLWRKNGAVLAGQTSSSFTLPSVVANDAATYSVEVTGACNTVSNAATLTVNQPTTATPLTSLTRCPGASATFATTAGGTGPFTYLWRKNGAVVAGQTSSSFTLPSVVASDAATYSVEVTGACNTVSNAATLTVNQPATATPLTSLTRCPGASATFATTAGGTGPFTYLWRKNGAVVAGQTSSSFTLPSVVASDAATYSVQVTGGCNTVSNAATLTVNQPVTATPLTSLTRCPGASATFATTAGGTGPFTYLWRKNGAVVAGQTSSSFTLPSVVASDAATYSVQVTGGCNTVSNAATLTVNQPVTATPLTSLTRCPGASATFATTAGGTGPFTYLWRKNGAVVAGQTSSSFTLPSVVASDAATYSVEVTGACNTVSNAATLTVNQPATATPLTSLIRCPGASATFATTAAGTGPFAYLWRKNGVVIAGQTSSSFTLPSVAANDVASYSVQVAGACNTVSNAATLTVNQPTTATPLTSLTRRPGETAAFSTTPSGTGPFSFQWLKDGLLLPNQFSNTLTIASVTANDAGTYTVRVIGVCNSVSNTATLTVRVPPSITQQPASLIVTQGSSANFSVSATGDPPLSYQWRRNGANLGGATSSSSFSIGNTQPGDAGNYDVIVANNVGSVTSQVATLTVRVPASLTTILSEGFEGAFPGAWTLGGTGFQWDDIQSVFGGEGAHTGNRKGYCAGTRYGSGSDEANPEYVSGMVSSMSMNISLAGYSAAYLSFWYKIPSIAPTTDQCAVLVNGSSIWVRRTAATGWSQATLDLSAYVGATPTLTFQFVSDGADVAEGWYLDDIVVTALVAPLDDDFVNATLLDGPSGTLYGNNINASKETAAGEPNIKGNSGGKSVWYRWTARTSGTVTFTTTGSGIPGGGCLNTLLAAYTGNSVGSLSILAENDDAVPGGDTSSISFNIVAGTEYKIAVDGYNGVSGKVVLNWSYNDAFNVSATVERAAFTRSYLVKTVPGKDYFIGKADFTLRRYDDFTGIWQTDPITVRLDYWLVDTTAGTNVTLTASNITLVKTMPRFDEVFLGPREPAYRSFLETFPVQPAPGVQLDSVNRRYQLGVRISHVDAAGQPALTDHTRVGASEQLLHFNGRLFFGAIETTFSSIANNPPIIATVPPSAVVSELAVDVLNGVITGRPMHRYGTGASRRVNLDPNGDAHFAEGAPVTMHVFRVPAAPDTDEAAQVRYERLAGTVTLSDAGARGTLRVTLPTGLGWRPDMASRKLFGTLDFPSAVLNQLLDPIEPELIFGGLLFVCEESKPFWIVAPYLSWQVAAGTFVLPPGSAFLYVRRDETDRLAAAQASVVLANSDQGRKRSNEGYCRAPVTVTSPQVSVRADANGHALMSASLRFDARPEGFYTHFPYDSFVGWSGLGAMQILDDQVQPLMSVLNGVLPVSLAYARDCPDATNCPSPAKGSETLTLNPDGQQLHFTVDGGLAGTGMPSSNTLTWGWIASKNAFAQRATNFTDAAFHAPGIFLRGDQAAAQAVEDRPATLLYTGVGQTDLTQLDRYGTPAYAEGLGDYAGLNFRARTNTVPPGRGASMLAGRPTGEYPLTGRSKYYARPGGVSGIHEAISFPGRLELYGYQVNFNNFGLSYLDSENHESRTQGFIPLPAPSQFTNEFEELTFTCLGALKDAKVPASSTNKLLAYWQGKFDPLAIQFASDTPCDPAKGFLVLGVVTRVAHIDAPLYGRLGFTSNGTIITAADHLVSNVTSRLRLPNRFNLKGPAAESYTFNPVGEAYFNNWDDFKAPGVGFVNLAGTLDVPFFEDLQVQMQTSANTNSSSAPIYLMGGWPAGKGWTDLAGRNYFTAPAGFDDRNRGFPDAATVDQYRKGNTPSAGDYLVRARQNWLGIVSFDYPLSWSSTRRTFQSPAPKEDKFAVLQVKHQVKYLSPQNAHLSFGLQYDGVPQINLANMAFNAIDDATGIAKGFENATLGPVRDAVKKGLQGFDQLLQAQMQDFLAPVVERLTSPAIDTLYNNLSNDFRLNRSLWPANADAVLKPYLVDGSSLILAELKNLDGSVSDVFSMVGKVDGYLKDVTNAIQQIQGVITDVPKAAMLIQKVAAQAGSAGRVADDAVMALLKEAGPTLVQISSTLSNISATVAAARSALAGGDFKVELDKVVMEQTSALQAVCEQVRHDMTNFFAHLDYTATSPFNEHSPEEIKKLIRQKLTDHLFASTVAPALQNVFKQRLYDTDAALREAIDSAFGQFNSITKDLIAQSLAEVDKSINGFAEPLNKVMGSGKIDGYAQIKGDSLVCLRLDGSFQWKVPDEMEFKGYLQIKELDSDGTNTCVTMGGKATEVTVGARDVALGWISPKLRADVDGKFSFATGSPIGMGGAFRVTGPLEFSGFKITELGATMAFGRDENYLGAKARVKFQQYEFAGGIFFGKTCTMAPLELVDPLVAESLPPAPLTGAYVYAEGWFPINEAIGIPSSCFFNVRAGVGAGAFYFLAGAGQVPTYGGKMLLGLSGEVLCIVSVEGKVVLVGVKSGGDLTFNGRGSVSGDIGKCPFCIGFSKSVGLRYRNGDWKLDF